MILQSAMLHLSFKTTLDDIEWSDSRRVNEYFNSSSSAEGFDPNYRFRSHNMESALHPAAANGNLEIIVILLQAGANIDAEDEDHKTPLVGTAIF